MVIKVPIVLSYTNTGTKKAVRDLKGGANSIEKAFKKMGLASKLSIAGITTSLGLLAKQSLAAAVAEEKQSRALQQTLKNLGKSYDQVPVAAFVNKLQFATGISEDELRPALQRLLTVTNNVAKSQELLQLALNVSAGTGKDLASVTNALSRAYLGNNSSLSRLGVNLTKAELKVASFDQITNKLASTYANQASQAATTFGGKLQILGVAADEAKEKIGVGLIGVLESVAGAKGFDGVTESIDRTSNSVVGLLSVVEKLTGKLSGAGGINFAQLIPVVGGYLAALEEQGRKISEGRTTGTPAQQSELATQRRAIAEAKVQISLAKKLRAEEEKKAKAARDVLASKRLAGKFDEQNIQIQAALKSKLDEEEMVRLKALIALKSESKADDLKALAELEAAQKKMADNAVAQAKAIAANPIRVYLDYVSSGGQTVTAPSSFGLPATNTSASSPVMTNVSPTPITPSAGGTPPAPITVNVNAGTIADENKLTYIISNELTKFVRFGGVTAPAGFI